MPRDSHKAALEEANKKIAEAHALIKEAEALANEHAIHLQWDLAYGMGGTFYGKGTQRPYGYWQESGGNGTMAEGAWVSSSAQC